MSNVIAVHRASGRTFRGGWNPARRTLQTRKYFADIRKTTVVDLPSFIDLEIDPFMFPCWDQGQIGSCVGHGISAGAMFSHVIGGARFYMPARMATYYDARIPEGTTDSDNGASIADGAAGIAQYGLGHETLWPYDPDKVTTRPSDELYADAALNRSIEQRVIDSTNRAEIQAAIFEKILPVFGSNVFKSIDDAANSASGVIAMPGPNESPIGGHCMVIVGYSDTARMYKLRNSWGTGIGVRGYLFCPYEYIENNGITSDMHGFVKMSEGGAVPINPPVPDPTPKPSPTPNPPPSPNTERGIILKPDMTWSYI